MFENQLLEVQESPFVMDLLPDLYQSLPGVLCCKFSAIWTLSMLYKVLDFKGLLENSVREDLSKCSLSRRGKERSCVAPLFGSSSLLVIVLNEAPSR